MSADRPPPSRAERAEPRERPPAAPPPDRAGPDGRAAGVREVGGPKGPEPTRYGDWEKGGRCSDF
jgi:hypothetical protein